MAIPSEPALTPYTLDAAATGGYGRPRGRVRGLAAGLLGDTAGERAAFLLAVFLILLFAGGWEKPLSSNGDVPVESPLIRALFYPGYLAGLALAATCWRGVLASLWRAPLLWALTAMAFVSVAWSIDPEMTGRRAVALVLSTLAAAAIGTRFGWRRLAVVLATGYGLMSLLDFVFAAFVPSVGRMQTVFPGAWDGLFVEKNGLGAFEATAAVIAFAAARLDPPRRTPWIVLGALGSALLLLSTSKTSLLGFLVGVMTLGFVWMLRRGAAAKVAATFLAVTTVLGLTTVAVLDPSAPLALLGKDATLTGRTLIWAAVRRRIAERPLTGYGYGAVFDDTSGRGPIAWIVKELDFRPAHAHDSWLMVWINLGVFAVALWTILLAWTWLQAIRASYVRRDADLALPLLAMFTVINLTESQALAYNSLDWMLFVTIAVRLAVPAPLP